MTFQQRQNYKGGKKEQCWGGAQEIGRRNEQKQYRPFLEQ
jgi:hypothetical protein